MTRWVGEGLEMGGLLYFWAVSAHKHFVLKFEGYCVPNINHMLGSQHYCVLCTYPGAATPTWPSIKFCAYSGTGDEGLSWSYSWEQKWHMEHGGWQSQAMREAQRIWVQQQEREGDGKGLGGNREGHPVLGELEGRKIRGMRRWGSRCKRA